MILINEQLRGYHKLSNFYIKPHVQIVPKHLQPKNFTRKWNFSKEFQAEQKEKKCIKYKNIQKKHIHARNHEFVNLSPDMNKKNCKSTVGRKSHELRNQKFESHRYTKLFVESRKTHTNSFFSKKYSKKNTDLRYQFVSNYIINPYKFRKIHFGTKNNRFTNSSQRGGRGRFKNLGKRINELKQNKKNITFFRNEKKCCLGEAENGKHQETKIENLKHVGEINDTNNNISNRSDNIQLIQGGTKNKFINLEKSEDILSNQNNISIDGQHRHLGNSTTGIVNYMLNGQIEEKIDDNDN